MLAASSFGGPALNSIIEDFLDSFPAATVSGPMNSLGDTSGCLRLWFLMPE